MLEHSSCRGMVVEPQLVPAMAEPLARVPAVADVIVTPGSGDAGTGLPGRDPISFAGLADGRPGHEPEVVVDDRDPLTYLYTSGTASFPKGVVGNHTAIYLQSLSLALEAGFTADDRFVAMLPMFHTARLNAHCTPAIMVGATIHIRRGFDAGELLAQIEPERITQIFGLSMMYREMLDHPDIARRDLSSLRHACYAMAPMPDAQLRRCLEAFGCDFYLLFGQIEMSPTATMFRPEHQLSHSGAVGTPVVNVRVGIMDDSGTLLGPGETGEIVYRGPHTMTEYLHDPEATDQVFATAGSTPATSVTSMTTASCGSATGARTSSRPAPRMSPPSRSRRPYTPPTRTSPRPSRCCRTTGGPRRLPRWSCRNRAPPSTRNG